MSRKLWRMLAAALLLAAFTVGISATTQSAQADPTVTTITWPGVPLPYGVVYAHGDDSVTVASDDCAYHYNYADTTPAIVTLTPDRSTSFTENKNTDGWKVVPCNAWGDSVAGSDGTIYFVQQNSSLVQRIIAVRRGVMLWTHTYSPVCNGNAQIFSLALGFDGNVYADVYRPTSCSSAHAMLTGFSASTGDTLFETPLPSSQSSTQAFGFTTEVMPYDTGIAVVNNGVNVYYYGYSGVQDTGKTFSPTVTSGTRAIISAITAIGRVYLVTQYTDYVNPPVWHIFYKDSSSSTINEVALPSGSHPVGNVRTTPNGGLAAILYKNSTYYLGYFDSSGDEVYEQQTQGVVSGIAVDNAGNTIIVQTVDVYGSISNQEVYVDIFSATGTKTRLFNSETEFGSPSVSDFFTTSYWTSQNVGDNKVYLALCHQTSVPGGGWPQTCTSSENPQIVVIPAPGSFDYPRSEMFTAEAQKANYVALGDSYASGEGNPPFIAPTDNDGGDGCDRSESTAYPVLLAQEDTDLALRAFVACSGATSTDVYEGYDGEPGQLDSLDASTSVATITVGGDDVGFSSFAAACVGATLSCDAGSSAYQYTMDQLDNYLQGDLETLFTLIRAAAPNATIYVVGYPEVVPGSGGNCPTYITGIEQSAIDTVVTGLNNKLRAAVSDMDSDFQFIDPTMTGSPFDGHDLCSADPYFFGLNIAQHNFSFHPNADGQAAYAELIADNM